MRKILKNHREVCHVWASRSQSEGRSGNISFKNDTIFSYHWWPMAQFHTTKSGKEYVFIRDIPYSKSTSKHLSYVRSAIPFGVEIVYVKGNDYDLLAHAVNLDHMIDWLSTLNKSFHAGRRPRSDFKLIEQQYDRLKQYCRIFKLTVPRKAKKYLLKWEDVVHFVESKEAHYQKLEDERKRKALIREAKLKEKNRGLYEEWSEIEERWMNGEDVKTSVTIPGFGHLRYSKTRLRINNDMVETSECAYVPVREAKILYERIKTGKDIAGFKIGYYTVIGINGTLKIGCHEIERQEIERFVNKYKW